MKRIFTLLACVCVLFGAMAQRPMATLSHGGKLTFFDSGSCFGEAVNAAVDGDTIFLSEGVFSPGGLPNNSDITKKVTVVGNGRRSHIVGGIIISIPKNPIMTSALFDGVRLEKVTIYDSIVNPEFKKCLIDELYNDGRDYGSTKDLRIDRCEIKRADCKFPLNSYEIYNSKIHTMGLGCGAAMNGRIMNSNVGVQESYSAFLKNSIVKDLYDNLDNYVDHCLISSELNWTKGENCYVVSGLAFDENLNAQGDISVYLGDDGTEVGINGGQWFHYSETPSVPTVDMSKSSFEIDKESNKLKVKVVVSPN